MRRGLCHAQPLNPDAKPGVVHHREHRCHAAMGLSDHPAGGAIKLHHRRGRAVQPQLMFQRDRPQLVGNARSPLCIGDEFRHHEKRNAFGSGHTVGQTGQDQMADIFGHIMIPPGDEDLLPGDCIGAIAVVLGLGSQRTHV